MFYIWHSLAIISFFAISFFGGYSLALKNEARNQLRKATKQ